MLPFIAYLIPLVIIIIALLLPYITAYLNLVKQTFHSTMLEPADIDLMSSDVRDLFQPWIDRLTTYDFTGISYYRTYGGLINSEPGWGMVLQHPSQQIFAFLIVQSQVTAGYPVLCILSSYLQKIHLNTVNVKYITPYNTSKLEKVHNLDKANVDELWLGHQAFLASICRMEILE
jgi:hypothetical protein